MSKEKVRIYSLARELGVESKDLLDLCRQAGYDVKNQLSSLDPDQRDSMEQLVKRGALGGTAVAVAAPSKQTSTATLTMPVPVLDSKVRVARREPEPVPTPPEAVVPLPAPEPPVQPSVSTHVPEPPAVPTVAPATVPLPKPLAAKVPESSAPPSRIHETPSPIVPPSAPHGPRTAEQHAVSRPAEMGARVPDLPAKTPGLPTGKGPDRGPPRQQGGSRPPLRRPVGSRPLMAHISAPPPLRQKQAKDVKKPQEPVAQKPIARPPEAMAGGTVNIQKILDKVPPGTVPPVGDFEEEDESGAAKDRKGRPAAAVPGRDKRHQQRAARAKDRKGRGDEQGHPSRLLMTDGDDKPQRTKDRIRAKLKKKERETAAKPDKIIVEPPITVRALSEALGLRAGDLLIRLMSHGAPATITINSIIDTELAESIAIDIGRELHIKKAPDAEDRLRATLQKPDDPSDLKPRPPIVTVMGHVDHGKTSLLDRIRNENVAATETGGITQVIRAWHVIHNDRSITFLDTPGHEAFTKMRARGANVTDIAVIVVAADDGVMPQTEEAINHAKAAGVSLVVAINKVDLPNANVNKARQQLYSMNVLPDNMGGDTPFVETSAATGRGIDELLESILLVAELKELKAHSTKPGVGTCLEAMLSEGEGVQATLLVQEGVVRRGDVMLCGASFGRIRAMYDDMGRPIQEAGPSTPVRITGLDQVPNADDPFHVLGELTDARDVAEKRHWKIQEASLAPKRTLRLESLSEAKVAELKVILKADFRGSIEAIRKELEKLQHDEVRVRILHFGIGAITESDVLLALTSPEDTIIVGFNVVPNDAAIRLAEDRGIQIREYDIIYNLTNDIRAALQGKLKPREEVVHLGRAIVRETFKISRVGTIAGCYVTQGVIERSSKIRVIREGVVIYPPTDRSAGLESLRRFKEDSREVREGFECGIKIAGYDDIKVGDVIEAYRIDQVQRTL